MKSIVIAALSIAFLTACAASPTEKAREINDELVYFKDHRSGLCFATWVGQNSTTLVLTHVPCDQMVERLLVNGAENAR